MALKRKLTKAEFDKLSKDVQPNYSVDEEDEDLYLLDVEGDEDASEMRRARDREKEKAKQLRKQLKETQDRLAELDEGEGDKTRKEKDIKTLDESWKTKLAEKESELGEKLSKKDQFIKKNLVKTTAEKIAGKISTVPALMAKAIAERLTVDFEDDEPVLVILDKDGEPSDMSLEKLEKEFVANKEYASIIVGSKASGSGAPRNGPEKKPGGAGASEKPVDLSKLSPKDLAMHLKAKKEAEAQ